MTPTFSPSRESPLQRLTVVVEGPLAFRMRRWQAARAGESGLQIYTLAQMAARLAGGFYRPALSEELEPAITAAFAAGGFQEIETMRQLPGVTRSAQRTLSQVWAADLILGPLASASPRVADLALLERRVLEALPPAVLAPRELRDLALHHVHLAPAILGPVVLEEVSAVVPVWRPLLRALREFVPLSWLDPAGDVEWFPGEIIRSAPKSMPTPEVVSCADPHAEAVEALRWARELIASGQARPQEIALCAPSTEPWDEHLVTLVRNAELPVCFSNGVPALSTHEGQACAALADVLLHGLSQDRIRRLMGHARRSGAPLEHLPQDWAYGLQPDATLYQLDQWRRALAAAHARRPSTVDVVAVLLPVLEMLSSGPAAAVRAGEALLNRGARILWLRALRSAPAHALEFSMGAMHVSDNRDPCASIVWCPASHLVGAARPWVRLLGLNSGQWPRRTGDDPWLPDHILPHRTLDPDPITEQDRRAFERLRARASGGCVFSRSRRDAQGRALSISPLIVAHAELTSALQRGRIPAHAFSDSDRLLARPREALATPHLAGALDCWRAWHSRDVGPHDGVVRADHHRIRAAVTRVQSATSLRLLLRDPLAFVWRYALGWSFSVEEEEPLTLNARDFGELVHELLRLAVNQLEPEPGYFKATSAQVHQALQAAVAATRTQWPLERAIPPPLLWDHTLQEAEHLAARALAFERDVQAATRCWTEVPFGQAEIPTGAWPWDPTTPVQIPGTDFFIRGNIDRLDLRWDGKAVRLSDYKTGAEPKGAESIVIGGGAELQRVTYAIAARQLLPQVQQVAARLVFLGQATPSAHKISHLDQAIAALARYVTSAAELLLQGKALPGLSERQPGDDFRLAFPADMDSYVTRKAPQIRRCVGTFAQVWKAP